MLLRGNRLYPATDHYMHYHAGAWERDILFFMARIIAVMGGVG